MPPDPREHPVEGRKGICAAGSCPHCGCSFRKPSDVLYHRCAAMQEAESAPPVREGLGAEHPVVTLWQYTADGIPGPWHVHEGEERIEEGGTWDQVEFVPAASLADLQAERDRERKAVGRVSGEMKAVAEELALQDRATADTLRYWITELGAGR